MPNIPAFCEDKTVPGWMTVDAVGILSKVSMTLYCALSSRHRRAGTESCACQDGNGDERGDYDDVRQLASNIARQNAKRPEQRAVR